MSTKHTPGPWRVAVSETDRTPMMNEIEIVAPGTVAESARPIARLSLQGIETKSNAHLIAAAPELLDALEVVKAIYELDEKTIRKHGFSFEVGKKCSEWAIEKINNAITKAKGDDRGQ